MADTTFSSGTVIASDWLNDVNSRVWKESKTVFRYMSSAQIADAIAGTALVDMTDALQAAADDGCLIFPVPGPYKSGQITVSDTCAMYGPATINLTGSDASAYQWCKFTASFSGFIAQDITVQGDNTEASSQYGFGPTTSSIVVTDAEFRNVSCKDVCVGIDASAMNGANIVGGKIGPTLGSSSGRGYGIAGGTASKNIRVSGVHFYRTSRHGCYLGATLGGAVNGCLFEEHGYGATPVFLAALVLARGQSLTASGNSFLNCVHNPAELADSNEKSGLFESYAFTGNTIRGCKRPMVVGGDTTTVDADNNTVSGAITGNVWHMPASSNGDCIKVYQADTLTISGNTFYWPSETIGITCITIDDVAANYPTNVLISGNNAYVNTTSGTKALVYVDTATCGSGSSAKITIKGNEVFGNGVLLQAAAAIQNSGIHTDSLQEVGITGATPYVSAYNRFVISQGGATNVTNFSGGYAGQKISIRFSDGNSTLTTANLYIAGGVPFVGTSNDQITLEYDGSNWRELCRSVN